MSDRCTGHCCQGFYLAAPDEMLALCWSGNLHPPEDGGTIARMVVHRGPSAHEGSLKHVYDCRHYDAAAGSCRIYDIRPDMCRRFPYGKPCEITGCTWTNNRPDVLVTQLTRRVKTGGLEP